VNSPAGAALLLASGALCGVGSLLAMRRLADQRALRIAKARIRAHLYELRLFGDDPVLALRAQKNLFVWNLRYLKQALVPALAIAIPAVLAAAQLEALYGRAPLRRGENTVVTAQLKPQSPAGAWDAALTAPAGFGVESPPVRIVDLRQICWRVRAIGEADGRLRLTIAGETIDCPIRAGRGLRRVSATCSSVPWAEVLSGCAIRSGAVESIHIDYAGNEVRVAGIGAHWLVWFALVWLAAMLGLRKRFGVVL
jgi:hypothetical protein